MSICGKLYISGRSASACIFYNSFIFLANLYLTNILRLPLQPGKDIFKHDLRPPKHGLFRNKCLMRCQQRILCGQQRIIFRKRRFHILDVKARITETPFIQCVGQCLIIHNRTSGTINKHGISFHKCDAVCIQKASGFSIERKVQ